MERMRELSEDDATGSIAEIYEEIKEYYAAPYVSSLFRHLATYPGLLEWIWKIMLPAFLGLPVGCHFVLLVFLVT